MGGAKAWEVDFCYLEGKNNFISPIKLFQKGLAEP